MTKREQIKAHLRAGGEIEYAGGTLFAKESCEGVWSYCYEPGCCDEFKGSVDNFVDNFLEESVLEAVLLPQEKPK